MKKIMIPVLVGILLLGIFTTFSPIGICEETNLNTIYVGGTGEGNYSSIQEAINDSSDGATIFVYSGIYNESITINKSISLIGEDKNTTIIRGNSKPFNVVILSPWTNITGFTVEEGSTFGIWINSIGNCNIYENIIKNNSVGIYILESNNNYIFHNNFINNTINANDSSSNFYSYESEGNYWHDYEGIDQNPQDGIGDTPYDIPGGNNQDTYPLVSPYEGRIILENYYVDRDSVQTMLIVGIIVAIIFCLPIGLWWRKKYFK